MRASRITLAEDDPNTLFLAQTMLARAFPGSSISTFSNAADALTHLLNAGTDILVTDHGMGSMSGAELIRHPLATGCRVLPYHHKQRRLPPLTNLALAPLHPPSLQASPFAA